MTEQITIGIGCGADAGKVLRSAEETATAELRIRCYCTPETAGGLSAGPFVELTVCSGPSQRLIDDLLAGTIDGAVRGTLPANETLRYLKKACGVDRLERIALLETVDHQQFFLAPVGVDEGWTIQEKISLINDARELARRFGLSEKTAVLSGGRLGDIGRHPIVDKTIADAEEIAKLTGAVHREILIEDAVKDCGIIIAPDGISGNLIFRTLTFLGHGTGHGAPVVNISPVFVDSSRASAGYGGTLRLTAALIRGNGR
ncbi:methanogenesis marker protein Mmp4/MtxX [Methanocorpusculum vombati]|uniref:Methanogenesis marker protein Mmp4/MtxX n=1 Tax=Methanocorpusculum vombati TaxID=3002864 RepID=A0ABT4IK92_9EURY|nr:methanogenesis marker protein Mmp4/MtxX [Methanocorpusculum vombati]MCZ9319415.1 methanogenesis marker protein Mmp4/MtxX [Methanocorpusculum sp.]MCZ0862151.1 methanogenesis marker protein Mmp4/MtxX [Methanocorpusculum vombati]MDE2521125.1 methanogenesis marker protein Mmp4/MtxX [Methanocorpusculum sp.]MDE2534768.1 methanogenesis marker protein Mmp4/MtxX [Methanocorpusculum sp.]MDE2546377.1 methanogenesis marker protein Mmp4/MtxX [Methanocorpusculum sp.]